MGTSGATVLAALKIGRVPFERLVRPKAREIAAERRHAHDRRLQRYGAGRRRVLHAASAITADRGACGVPCGIRSRDICVEIDSF